MADEKPKTTKRGPGNPNLGKPNRGENRGAHLRKDAPGYERDDKGKIKKSSEPAADKKGTK